MKKIGYLLLAFYCCCFTHIFAQAGDCDCDPVRDSLALMDFRNNTNINWDITKPVFKWEGIYTNPEGCIDSIVLTNKQLRGSVPASIFENLICLKVLRLGSYGYFAGEWNSLQITIPQGIGNLTQLEVLDLNKNNYSGILPETLFQLNNLRTLELKGLSAQNLIPGFEFRHLSKIGNLKKLEVLDLSENGLKELPSSFKQLINLKNLLLYYNALTSLPDSFTIFNSKYFDVSYNFLTFEDLIPIKINSPQRPFFPDTTLVLSPCDSAIIDLDIDKDIKTNEYVWRKADTAIAVRHTPILSLKEVFSNYEDYAGVYTCKVTNPAIPGLVLQTNRITVELSSPCLAAPKIRNDTLCYNDSLIVDSIIYSKTNPTGCKVFKGTSNACDTMLILDFHFRDTFDIIDTTLYWGERILIYNTWYDCMDTIAQERFISPFTGCDSTVFVQITCKVPAQLPTQKVSAFTPNGDNLNETFIIPVLEVASAKYAQNELIIFDRWKRVVFQQQNYTNDWNGVNKNGEPLPAGTYYYVFQYNNAAPLIGIVTIIR